MKRIRRFGAFFALAATLALSGCALLPEEEVLPEAPVQRTGAQERSPSTTCSAGTSSGRSAIPRLTAPCGRSSSALRSAACPLTRCNSEIARPCAAASSWPSWTRAPSRRRPRARPRRSKPSPWRCGGRKENPRPSRRRSGRSSGATWTRRRVRTPRPLSEVLRPYDRAIEDLQGQIEVARVRQAQTEAYVRERQLRAGISGVVTYARSLEKGTLSDETEVVFTISDAGSSLFVLSTKDLENFSRGADRGGRDRPGKAGLSLHGRRRAGRGRRCGGRGLPEARTTRAAALADGDRGAVTLELDRRGMCSTSTPARSSAMDDKRFVYVQDEKRPARHGRGGDGI